jgi:hypothetical protein
MPKINLFTCHFEQSDKDRQKELDFCFNTNKESGYFSEIINFSDRPTYNDFFKATQDYPSDINIFTNADIYFNRTILYAKDIKENEAYALTRWELNEHSEIVSFEERHQYNAGAKAMHSQDVWIVKGVTKNVNGYFHIGQPGCDNRIAYELSTAGYTVKNPSDIIQCIHKHKESDRDYTMPSKVNPPYMWVEVGGVAITPRNHIRTRRGRV